MPQPAHSTARRLSRCIALALVLMTVVGLGCASSGGATRSSATRAGTVERWTNLKHGLVSRTEVVAARIGSFIYAVGGFDKASGGATTAAVERYDIAADSWRRVKALPIPINHAAAVNYGGRLYVLGGYGAAR